MPTEDIDPSKVQWDETPQIDLSQVQWDQPEQPKDTLGGQVAAGIRGFRQALPFGQDIGAAAHALQRGQSFSEAKAREIAEDEARKAQYPGTYLAGEVAGSVAPFVAGPVAGLESAAEKYLAPKVGETAAKIGSGALLGAGTGVAQGLGQGVTAEERLKAAGEQGLMGGVAGGVASPIMGKIGKGISNLLPDTAGAEQAIKQAKEIGVDLPTYAALEGDTGKMLASGLSSVPFGSGPISEATSRALEQTGEAASKLHKQTGAATPAMAGTLAETNINNWIKGSSAAQLDAAFADMRDIVPAQAQTPITNLTNTVNIIRTGRQGARLKNADSGATSIVSEAVANPEPMTFADASRLRTEIGNHLSNIYRLPGDVNAGELKQLYGALTKDLEASAREAGGEEGFRAFQRANKMTNLIRRQQSNLAKIIGVREGTYSPENILGNIERLAATGSKGDIIRLRLAQKAVSPNDWQTISSGIIGKLGRDNEGKFSPNLFMTGYNKMAPNARDVLFGTAAAPVRKSLDAIEQVSYRLRDAMKFANTSKTSHAIHAMEFLTGMFYSPFATMGAAAASNGVARVLATPKTAQYAAGLARAIENAAKTASDAMPISKNAAVISAYNAYANAVRDTVGGEKRPERAKGGRIGKGDYPAKRLTLAAKRAHKEIADEFRPLMDMPDEHIAEALHRARDK